MAVKNYKLLPEISLKINLKYERPQIPNAFIVIGVSESGRWGISSILIFDINGQAPSVGNHRLNV